MWKTIYFNDDIYLIKLVNESPHKLYLTDMKKIWMEELNDDDMTKRFEHLNTLCIDANVPEELITIISSANNDNITFNQTDTIIKLEINITIDNFPLKYYWELNLQPQEDLFKIFTLTLINTIQYLELDQRSLHELLEKKDKEIDEYKREYGEISRDLLKTPRFVKNNNENNKDELLLYTLTNKEIFPQLMEKYGVDTVKEKSKSVHKVVKRKLLKPYRANKLK